LTKAIARSNHATSIANAGALYTQVETERLGGFEAHAPAYEMRGKLVTRSNQYAVR
jgi:hypothetical protein